jgi:hypothetical protein
MPNPRHLTAELSANAEIAARGKGELGQENQ